MQLIKELLSLNEADESAEDLTQMKQSPEKNLKAVETVLRFDGDIPLDNKTHNQADKMGTQDGKQMFYVALAEPYGNVEAYVVVDKNGKISYYDFTDELVVINGKFASRDQVTREWADEMEDIVNQYKLESGRGIEDGAIKAFMAHLEKAKDKYSSDDDDDDQY